MTTVKAKPAKPTKTGSGLDRMKANLGPAKTEALRQEVLTDQTKARSAITGGTKAAQVRGIKSCGVSAGIETAALSAQLRNGGFIDRVPKPKLNLVKIGPDAVWLNNKSMIVHV